MLHIAKLNLISTFDRLINGLSREELLRRLQTKFSTSEARYILRCLTEDMLQKDSIETDVDNNRISSAVDEIMDGKPLQYVTGFASFFKMKFIVNSFVLIPRPETEELVEWILENYNDELKHVLDIGTGSGCISVALKRMKKDWNVDACDVSAEALNVAVRNATLNYADVKFFEMDISNPTVPSTTKYDLVVSNPPYIAAKEVNTLQENVVNYEPHIALFAPSHDPFFFYKAITDFALQHLNSNGSVYVEINQNLAEETFNHFVPYFRYVEMRKDISGNFRMLYANGLKSNLSGR